MPWRPTFVAELPSSNEGKEWGDFWENLRLPRSCVSCDGCHPLRFGNAKRQHRVNWAVNKAKKLALKFGKQRLRRISRNGTPCTC